MKNVFLLLMMALTIVSARAQDDDPMKYFDDGGLSERKNLIYCDATSLLRPAYVFGYERWFSERFSASAGVIFLNSTKEYKFLFADIDMNDDWTFRKADNALNFSLRTNYFFLFANRNFHNFISLGFDVIHYDSARTQDLFFSKSIVSYEFKNCFFISLELRAGMRFKKVIKDAYLNDPWYSFIYGFPPRKIVIEPYVHLPLRIGIKF